MKRQGLVVGCRGTTRGRAIDPVSTTATVPKYDDICERLTGLR